MKVLSRTSAQLALTLFLPLIVLAVGYWIEGSLVPSVIVTTAAVAAISHIAVTIAVDLQTVVDVEFEVYQRVARRRQELLLQEEEQVNRLQLAATIHDTVINTLCAVTLVGATSGATRDLRKEEQLQQRCRDDWELLQYYSDQGDAHAQGADLSESWLQTMLPEVERHAVKSDLELDVRIGDIQQSRLGCDTQALTLAIREALTNIAKHSAHKQVGLDIDQDRAGLVVTVTSAWSPLPSATWDSPIEDFSLFSLGTEVETSVACELPGALVVTIRPGANGHRLDEPIDVVIQDHIAIPLMRTTNFWLTGLNIIVMMMFFSIFPWWMWLFTGLLAVSVSMSLTNLASLRRCVTPSLALLVALSSAALIASPIFVAQVTTVDPLSQWWILLGDSLILVAAAWTLPTMKWVWATFVASCLGAFSLVAYQWLNEPEISRQLLIGILGAAVVAGLIIIAVASKARALTDSAGQRIADELRLAAAQDNAATLAELRTEVRNELIGRCMEAAGPVLLGISTGEVDPNDPEDRQAIWLLERQLRSAISLGREQDPLSGLLFELLWQAHDRGIELKVNSYRGGLMDAGLDIGRIGVELQEIIQTGPVGTVLSVSTYETAEARRLLIVTQQPGEVDQEIHEYELSA